MLAAYCGKNTVKYYKFTSVYIDIYSIKKRGQGQKRRKYITANFLFIKPLKALFREKS